jgi:hypothetical protein
MILISQIKNWFLDGVLHDGDDCVSRHDVVAPGVEGLVLKSCVDDGWSYEGSQGVEGWNDGSHDLSSPHTTLHNAPTHDQRLQ